MSEPLTYEELQEQVDEERAAVNDARDAAEGLLKDKGMLLRLLGWSEHEFDCERARLEFADPAKFLHERLVDLAGL